MARLPAVDRLVTALMVIAFGLLILAGVVLAGVLMFGNL